MWLSVTIMAKRDVSRNMTEIIYEERSKTEGNEKFQVFIPCQQSTEIHIHSRSVIPDDCSFNKCLLLNAIKCYNIECTFALIAFRSMEISRK